MTRRDDATSDVNESIDAIREIGRPRDPDGGNGKTMALAITRVLGSIAVTTAMIYDEMRASSDPLISTADELSKSNAVEYLRAELARMRPVFDLARRWCNRPLSVTRAWMANDAELFAKLHELVAEAIAKEPK